MKRNKKLLVLLALFLAVFAVGGTIAYLTDTTTETTNTFTFGKVDIELTEAGWEAANAEDLNPGAVVDKDPKVVVKEGSKPAYVFMEVTMPAQVNSKDVLALTNLDTTNWAVVNTSGTKTVYAYVSGSSMKKVDAKNADVSTEALFDKVTVNNTLTNTDVQAIPAAGLNIVIKGYAIQADDLPSTATTPAQIWALLQ